jgi:parallel beta-helix repeat protein
MGVKVSIKAGKKVKGHKSASTRPGQIFQLRNRTRAANRPAPFSVIAVKILVARKILVLIFLAWSGVASATTYYVSSSAGSDSNNGTSASTPWQTIAHVNGQTFSPGDSVLFKRGDVWNESLAPASSGSSGNPIAFDAYGTGVAPNLTGYYAVPTTAWVLVTGNAWKAPVPSTYSAINFCLFGSVWGQKVAAVSSNLTARRDFYLASGFVYIFSVGSPATYYNEAIVPMALSNVPVINVNGQTWLTFQHFLVNWFDQYGVYVQGASDHLVFANMEADSMIPQGTQPLGFYVDESAPGPGDIKIYNSEAHLDYDGFRFDGAASAITMVNDKAYANRDGALVDDTGAVTYAYCHFYASSLAVAGSTDVEYTSGTGPIAGAGNIAADTAPAVQVYQRYPAEVTLTVDDEGMTPNADTYYAGTVLPVADAVGVPVGAAITVGYPLAQTLISEFQGWVNAGRDVTSHSVSHTYYTNTDALDVQYTGGGTAATLSISSKTLTITVTGASDSVSYNLTQGQPQGTILGLQQALAATGKFTTAYLTPCQGPYGTGCSAYTAAALLAQDLADVSGQDVETSVYHMQLNVTRLATDEITLSRQWMTTNLTGLPATPVYVYPGGYETTAMQGITEGVPYSGARGALKENLGVKDTYADGFNVENITSFGVNPSWMGLAPAVLNQKIQALVWKESVWGVPWGIFWHLNELTNVDPVGGTEITNLIQDFKASGATIRTNTGLVNWLLGGTQQTGTDGNDYYTFPATSMTLDFRPTKNSPVVDAGQNLGVAYELDINGVNQNSYGSGWEIGAHVYQGYVEYGTGVGSNRFVVGTTVNYYVSSAGSDANNCLSSGAACLTIAHAESLSAAGDAINIAAGTYRLSTANSSTAGYIAAKNSQTFVGPACTPTAGPCTAIISGGIQLCSGSFTCSGPDGNGNWSVTGMTQQGIATQPTSDCDSGWTGCIYPEDLFINGVPLQHINAVTLPTLTSTSWWFDYTNDIIYFHQNPAGNTVETSVLETMFQPNGVSGIILNNLTIKEFAVPLLLGAIDPAFGNIVSTSSFNWTIENSYITLNHGYGVRCAFGEQVLNSVLTANGNFGTGGGCTTTAGIIPSGVIIQGNTVTYNNYAHVAPGFGAGGMKFGNTAGAVVRGNIVSNNVGQGIHFDVDSISPLIDGNTVTNNVDSAASGSSSTGITFEIGNVGATVRNNVVQYNGTGETSGPNYQVGSADSAGMQAYCNVIETGNSAGQQAWSVFASNRGDDTVQPFLGQQIVSTGNYVHHNVVIWDSGSTASVGYSQNDTADQPDFFANNTPPNFNQYHASSTALAEFIYDHNNSGSNTATTFANYQAAGADVGGTIDTIYTSGFPAVAITFPADQSTVANPVTITASASDASGISKVQFYVDWTLQATVTTGPYSYNWAASAGPHTIAAMAFSNAGIQSCNAVTLNGPPA